ncbi:MAG: alpha-mannosidase [Clostridia bacterium]|nr:alpha-mannosidase [Clostridia bacterium]
MAKLHLIGNSHLDPVWLWRWQEGFSEILATYRSALDRMQEFPDFKFTSACAVYYQWIEKMDPDMFREIQERVKEGRWNIVGGWFLQPDCNIPSGESFARHGLISQRYFKEKFGVVAKTGYNVDSFGHNASLPQILKKSGMDNYVFMRPFPNEQGRDEDVFKWESADGTQVNTYRIPQFYNIDLSVMEIFDEIKQKAEKQEMDMMAFYGVGNHGGGPTIKLLDAINRLEIPDMIYSTPDEYFDEIDKEKLPVIADELQHHARGCYSASTFVKTYNRKCENNLIAAEKFCSMASYLVGTKYPKKKLDKAWKNLLFNQFHDILAGCCIKKAYDDAGYLYGEIMSITEQEINYAIQSITHKIHTLRSEKLPSYKIGNFAHWHVWENEVLGTPVVVFNPHSWTVKMPVQVNMVASKVTDENDIELPFQIVRGDQTNGAADKWNTLFMAEVEPMGYAVYRFFTEQEGNTSFKNELNATKYTLENKRIKVEFSPTTGDICRVYDKQKHCDILKGECSAILLDESASDTWAHHKTYLGEYVGRFEAPEFSIIEEGNVRATLRVTTRYNQSVLRRDYSIEPDSTAVKVNVMVDYHEKHKTLKFTFPTEAKQTISKIPYGTITRNNGLGEEPSGSWLASGNFMVANDGKYGYDTTENEVRLTILRSAIYADHFGERDEFCEYMEQGIHECSYMVCPYESNVKAEKSAEELNFPLRYVIDSFHEGPLSERQSCFKCDGEHVVVTAVKQAEDSDSTIVRFCEMDGIGEEVSITIWGKELKTSVTHHEIKTLKEDGTEVNLIEW